MLKRSIFAEFLQNETAFLWIYNLLISQEKTPNFIRNNLTDRF